MFGLIIIIIQVILDLANFIPIPYTLKMKSSYFG